MWCQICGRQGYGTHRGYCDTCWDATTQSAIEIERDALRDENERLRAMLETHQYADSKDYGCRMCCPECKEHPHAEWCELADLLRKGDGKNVVLGACSVCGRAMSMINNVAVCLHCKADIDDMRRQLERIQTAYDESDLAPNAWAVICRIVASDEWKTALRGKGDE